MASPSMSSGTALAVSICFTAGIAGGVQAAVMGGSAFASGSSSRGVLGARLLYHRAANALLLWSGLCGCARRSPQPAWLWVGGIASIYIVLAATVGAADRRRGDDRARHRRNLIMAALMFVRMKLAQDAIPIDRWRILGLLLLAAGLLLLHALEDLIRVMAAPLQADVVRLDGDAV